MQWRNRVPVRESALTSDNLYGQTTDQFNVYIKKECNSLVWLYPGGCTDACNPSMQVLRPVAG